MLSRRCVPPYADCDARSNGNCFAALLGWLCSASARRSAPLLGSPSAAVNGGRDEHAGMRVIAAKEAVPAFLKTPTNNDEAKAPHPTHPQAAEENKTNAGR